MSARLDALGQAMLASVTAAPGAATADLLARSCMPRTRILATLTRLSDLGLITILREGGVSRHYPAPGVLQAPCRKYPADRS